MTTGSDIDTVLDQVDAQLSALAAALRLNDAEALAAAAAELQGTLEPLHRAGRVGRLPTAGRRHLAELATHTAAQRESLARAGAALKRAIDVLLPGSAPGAAYAADGLQPRQAHSGSTRA